MKSTSVAVLAMAGSAAAFAPSSSFTASNKDLRATTLKNSATTQMSFRNEMAGGIAPTGPFWDPVGLGKVDDKQLKKFREAELKHGRVCMLAAVGMVVQRFFTPFWLDSTENLSTPAFQLQDVIREFPFTLIILFAFIASAETITIATGWSKSDYRNGSWMANLKDDYQPGSLGFDPLGLYPKDAAGQKTMQDKEISNGRLAMIAVIGMWAQELVGNPIAF